MNKAQLIHVVASLTDLPKTVASRALDAVLDSITKALAEGDIVSLIGFGTFGVKTRAARTGRNPRTGAEIKIPQAQVPSFKAGKALKESVSTLEIAEEI